MSAIMGQRAVVEHTSAIVIVGIVLTVPFNELYGLDCQAAELGLAVVGASEEFHNGQGFLATRLLGFPAMRIVKQ